MSKEKGKMLTDVEIQRGCGAQELMFMRKRLHTDMQRMIKNMAIID